MHRESIIGFAIALFWLALPSTAGAQERAGFWGGFGGGWGSARVTAAELDTQERAGSGVANLRLGWTLSKRVLVGGEFDFWRKNRELSSGIDANFNIYNLSGTLTYYPGAQLFLKGGAGTSYVNVDFDQAGSNARVELGSGFGLILGAGYDVPLTPSVSLTPAINVWSGRLGTLDYQGRTLFTDWKQNVFDITIGLTFH